MNFASFPYLVFLGAVCLSYFQMKLPNRKALFLLLASYLFYSIFGFGFAILMIFTTLTTFVLTNKIHTSTDATYRKLWFYLALGIDTLVFILFKYLHIIDIKIMNWPNFNVEQLLIPIGISYYTFKTVGYSIDIYKRKYPPENSFVYYALSVSFFPQLIAGPIEKSKIIIEQLKKNTKFNYINFVEGSRLILWGLFKKIIIADTIAASIAPCYSNITDYRGLDLIILLFAYVYQIYADFSGYSDIAIGSAKCLNVNLPSNFFKPFHSKSIREFWIRWHSSFSKWVKEYIFDNLGGISRGNHFKTIVNIWVLFLFVGVWHGFNWNYFFYGQVAFLWMTVDILLRKINRRWRKKQLISILNYFIIMIMSMSIISFFRPQSLNESFYIWSHLLDLKSFILKPETLFSIFCIIGLMECIEFFQTKPNGTFFEQIKNSNLRIFIYLIMIFSLIIFSSRPDYSFQYYQF